MRIKWSELREFHAIKLRKNYNIDPTTLTTTHNFQHQQVYPFTYHHLKLNIHSKQRPELRRYINWLERSLDRKMFLSGPRCSSTQITHNLKAVQKDNITPELTRLALNSQPKNTKKSPHEIVQDFFMINDSTTVATELPVYIRPKEVDLDINEPITGHIDLVQIRYDNLYILDYITRALPDVKGGTRSCANQTSTDRNATHPN